MKNKRLYILNFILAVLIILLFFVPNFLLERGKSALNRGDYIKAYNHLNLAIKLRPYNKEIRYCYVKTLTKFRSNLKIQKSIYKFSDSRQNDSAKLLAGNKVYSWKYNILRTYGITYIDHVTYDNKVLRWDINTFPLKVYIESTRDKNLPNYYISEIKRCFTNWKNASGFITFTYVKDAKNADIVVKFSDVDNSNCGETGCKYVVAYTVPIIKINRLNQMVITVYERDPYGKYLSTKELHNTVLHEIGHALGIMGHSNNPDDLMYMSTNQNQIQKQSSQNYLFFTQSDIRTLKLLYKLMPDITNVPISQVNTTGLFYAPIILGNAKTINMRKLVDAQNYIKKAPKISGGYIDLGIAQAELGNTEEAKKAFNRALALAANENERALAYYNLAVVSMNEKKYKDAMRYAEISKSILPSEEINELLTAIRQYLSLGIKLPVSNYLLEK